MKRIILVITIFLSSSLLLANNPKLDQNSEETLLEGLKSGNIGLQVSSAIVLGELKSEYAVNPLTKVLRNSEDSRARKAAAQSLVKIGTERSLYVIRQAVRFNDNADVRKICSKLLSGSGKNKNNTGNEYYAAK